MQRGRARGYGEVKFRRRDAELIDLAVTTSFLKAGASCNHSIVVLFKDITELKDLDRARRRVLAHLSHELNTPLSIVMASVKKLATSENRPSIARITRIIKDDTPVLDPGMLEKIVNGFIRNAIENTPDGGRIILEISRKERETYLTVADTGIGITKS